MLSTTGLYSRPRATAKELSVERLCYLMTEVSGSRTRAVPRGTAWPVGYRLDSHFLDLPQAILHRWVKREQVVYKGRSSVKSYGI